MSTISPESVGSVGGRVLVDVVGPGGAGSPIVPPDPAGAREYRKIPTTVEMTRTKTALINKRRPSSDGRGGGGGGATGFRGASRISISFASFGQISEKLFGRAA